MQTVVSTGRPLGQNERENEYNCVRRLQRFIFLEGGSGGGGGG
jgi:hypothetical protein